MALISKKKLIYPINEKLHFYLKKYNRVSPIHIHYTDLLRYTNSIPLYDKNDEDTLWITVFYNHEDMFHIHESLKKIYANLKADGHMDIMSHLYIDRIDLCTYGNTKPFRVRIVNQFNDNFDYFYVKQADASRVYGLELEDLLSPNKVSYMVHEQTLIEEHIAGIPGDQFIATKIGDSTLNKTRLIKEFVKFNERCFIRLLGDMHTSNFVVVEVPDFDDVSYRLRAIDFDQQSYEGKRSVYLPQYFKQNNPFVELGIGRITPQTLKQYQIEERSMVGHRIMASHYILNDLIDTMKSDRIAPRENVFQLRNALYRYYKDSLFLKCDNMGEILEESLHHLLRVLNIGKTNFVLKK
ncbi:hypothetical protein [Sediminitomix flava]|uniref:Uncharacterized protein n=1 Tax=Sediminitomix flava TaxID=379075 RepID=A0A315ZBE3_SEDFL|nr:hypothetical protein [Sediminitomix flava]PWJ42383.1 hypothetical protein BC781_103635 [Sediminitomix flava]